MSSKALKKRSEEELNKSAYDDSSDDEDDESHQQEKGAKNKKAKMTSGEEDDDAVGGEAGGGGRYENLERLKREKRLAMNRECARARRRRKKLRLELLETRVQDLTQKNTQIQDSNDALRARVAQLEGELSMAKSTIAMLSGGAAAGAAGHHHHHHQGMMDSGRLGAPPNSDASQNFLNEKFNLQRRAALLSGAGGAGGPGAGLGGFGGAAGGGQDPSAALRYMQLMQGKNPFAAAGANPQFGGPGAAGGFSSLAGAAAENMAGAGGGGGAADYSGMY